MKSNIKMFLYWCIYNNKTCLYNDFRSSYMEVNKFINNLLILLIIIFII